jgi:hypothetical protein
MTLSVKEQTACVIGNVGYIARSIRRLLHAE